MEPRTSAQPSRESLRLRGTRPGVASKAGSNLGCHKSLARKPRTQDGQDACAESTQTGAVNAEIQPQVYLRQVAQCPGQPYHQRCKARPNQHSPRRLREDRQPGRQSRDKPRHGCWPIRPMLPSRAELRWPVIAANIWRRLNCQRLRAGGELSGDTGVMTAPMRRVTPNQRSGHRCHNSRGPTATAALFSIAAAGRWPPA